MVSKYKLSTIKKSKMFAPSEITEIINIIEQELDFNLFLEYTLKELEKIVIYKDVFSTSKTTVRPKLIIHFSKVNTEFDEDDFIDWIRDNFWGRESITININNCKLRVFKNPYAIRALCKKLNTKIESEVK